MDSHLIDNTLLDLLRMPEAKRTQEVIASHLVLAATAAGIQVHGSSPLQLEQLKLHSAVTLLTRNLGENFTHRTNLRLADGIEGMELFASIESAGDLGVRFTAFGGTAERVLAKLREEISQHGRQAEKKAQRPRAANRDPLRHLPKPKVRA